MSHRSLFRLSCLLSLSVCTFGDIANGASVTGWLKDLSFGSGSTVSLTNAHTASPILGNNTSNNADNAAIYAPFPLMDLANGQRLTLSATAQLIGTATNPDFRWGLFKDDGVGAATGGWLGFMASAESTLWSKDPSGSGFATATFASATNGRAAAIGQAFEPNKTLFEPGVYSFSMTLERFGNEIDVQVAIHNASTGDTIVSEPFTEVDPSRLTYGFDRVGFLAGSALDADQIRFTDVDVSLSNVDLPRLEVHSSGLVVLANRTEDPVEFVQYEITSNAGSLRPGGWNSLDSRENEDPMGSGWDEVGLVNQQLLAEVNLLGSKVLGAGEHVSLGNAFEADGTKDLAFRHTTAAGNVVRGVVEYLQSGDYNRDGAVNSLDYVLWRMGNGTQVPSGSQADGDGNGLIDTADYQIFTANFGEPVESSTSTAAMVPEPTLGALGLLATLYLIQTARLREQRAKS